MLAENVKLNEEVWQGAKERAFRTDTAIFTNHVQMWGNGINSLLSMWVGLKWTLKCILNSLIFLSI